MLCASQYSNTEQVPASQQLGVEVALLSVETVEHEKLSPRATGTQECQRGRVCSVWPHGATGEASSFWELGQRAEQTRSRAERYSNRPATTRLAGCSLCALRSTGDLIAASHFSPRFAEAKFTVRRMLPTKHKRTEEEQLAPGAQFLRALSHKLDLHKLWRALLSGFFSM